MEKAQPKKPAEVQEDPNPQAAMQESPEAAAERAERVQKLLTGRIQPPNPVVSYMLDKLRKVLRETEGVNSQLQQWEARTAQARNRLMELNGMRMKYLEDIAAFDKEQPAKPVGEEPAPVAEKGEAAA